MAHYLFEEYKAISLSRPQAITADGLSSAVSVEEFEDDAVVIVNVGAVSGTSPTLDIQVHASDASGGTYASIGAFAQVNAANKIAVLPISLKGSSRKFLKVDFNVGGTSPSFTCDVVLLARPTVAASGINSATFA